MGQNGRIIRTNHETYCDRLKIYNEKRREENFKPKISSKNKNLNALTSY